MQHDGRTATPSLTPATASSSHVRRGPANAQATLLIVCELLCYHPAYEGYDAWVGCIIELDNATGEAPVSS